MNRTSKSFAAGLAIVALAAPAAQALIPHEPGQSSAPAASSCASRPSHGSCWMSATPLSTARPAPPVVRMDGLLPDSRDAGRSFDATATAVTPPDRLDSPVPAAPRPIVADTGKDFDWTAAGIGFAAAAGAALFGAGSLRTVRWRRHERTLAH